MSLLINNLHINVVSFVITLITIGAQLHSKHTTTTTTATSKTISTATETTTSATSTAMSLGNQMKISGIGERDGGMAKPVADPSPDTRSKSALNIMRRKLLWNPYVQLFNTKTFTEFSMKATAEAEAAAATQGQQQKQLQQSLGGLVVARRQPQPKPRTRHRHGPRPSTSSSTLHVLMSRLEHQFQLQL